MTIAEIIQIIIGMLSLIATVAVSIVIARVETKRAKRQHRKTTRADDGTADEKEQRRGFR